MAVRVLDDYYLAITFLVTVAYQLTFFALAFTFKFDKLTDFAGGTNFTFLAILTLAMSGTQKTRNVLASVFMIVYSLRLAGFLLFRILKTGKDERFNEIRDKFFKFLGFWIFQMFWVWTVSLPITFLNSPNILRYPQPAFGTGRDIAGIVLYALGLIIETLADIQKYRWRSNNQDKNLFMTTGLFRWSRHPNYFGEIVLQFGIWLLCLSPSADGAVRGGAYIAQYASIVGAFFVTFLLMGLSGVPQAEPGTAKRRYEKDQNYDAYARWINRTSVLFPVPPAIYSRVPTFLKRTIFLDFPWYHFNPEKSDVRRGQNSGEGENGEQNRTAEPKQQLKKRK